MVNRNYFTSQPITHIKTQPIIIKQIQRTIIFSLLFAFIACKKESKNHDAVKDGIKSQTSAVSKSVLAATANTLENFESGTKGYYAAADVTLSTGVRNFNDSLIGNLASDAKNGTQSARVRNSGKLTMKFDHAGGASTVTVFHEKFGTDANTSCNFGTAQMAVPVIRRQV